MNEDLVLCTVCRNELSVIEIGSAKDLTLKSVLICVNDACTRHGLLSLTFVKLKKGGAKKDDLRTKDTPKQNGKND